MKNLIDLYRLRQKLLLRSSVLVIPTVFTTVFLGTMYSMTPIGICSSFLVSAVYLYFICIFISMSIHGKESDVFEETLLLHCKKAYIFYGSREMMLAIVCFIYSIVLTLAPVLLYLINSDWFIRKMENADFICGGIYIFLCGISGMVTGDLFHPRIINQRKTAIICVILVSVLAVCKHGLATRFAILKVLDYLLPPFMDGFHALVNTEYFNIAEILMICLHMVVYAVVVTLIKIKLFQIKRFRY